MTVTANAVVPRASHLPWRVIHAGRTSENARQALLPGPVGERNASGLTTTGNDNHNGRVYSVAVLTAHQSDAPGQV
jgi:hypothetical protein